MARPKKATAGRKALVKKDANVVESKPAEAAAAVDDEVEDLEEQLRIVNLVCNAVDQEDGSTAGMKLLPFDKLRTKICCAGIVNLVCNVVDQEVELKPVEAAVAVDDEVEDLEEQLRIVNLVCNAVDQEVEDLEEQLRIVNLVCNAVDQEVESRSAAILAIGDGHMASATTQLQLLISKFPEHIRKMPMKKFLKEHCPNTKANTRPDGTLSFDLLVEDAAALTMGGSQLPDGGIVNFNALNLNTGFASVRNTPGFASVRNTPGFGSVRNAPGFVSVQNTPGFGQSQTMTGCFGEGVSNKLADQKGIEQYSWDEFLTAYRMQSAMKGPSAWDTPSLRTPGMNWRDTMITRNFTPMTEKIFPSMLPSQTGDTLVGRSKRKATTSRGLRM